MPRWQGPLLFDGVDPGSGEAAVSGSLVVVGLGPGSIDLLTPAAARALQAATDFVGYETYLDRIPKSIFNGCRHASGNGFEIDRARHALALAAEGKKVAVVSGGDPGVFAMAAAVFEAIEAGDPAWRELNIHVEPGITAMLAAAAEVGAPLGADFCAISLSDNLKSWETIERRLRAAAEADFVIALYNPASRARPNQLGRAFDLLRAKKSPQTVVLFVRSATTPEARVVMTELGEADPALADMRTLVIIGAVATRLISRNGRRPFVYTPRAEREVVR